MSTYQSNSRLLICRKTNFIENNFSFFVVEDYLKEENSIMALQRFKRLWFKRLWSGNTFTLEFGSTKLIWWNILPLRKMFQFVTSVRQGVPDGSRAHDLPHTGRGDLWQARSYMNLVQSNLYITVTLGKWPGDRYIKVCIQVSLNSTGS